MFLLYETGMRVVIHTANMIEADWHQKTNGVWISELFPRFDPNASKASNPKSTDSKTNFRSYLIMYLEHYEKKELKIWIDHLKTHNTMSAKYFFTFSYFFLNLWTKYSSF
jgi:tyrosyl-DNA phosphodiesterase-1